MTIGVHGIPDSYFTEGDSIRLRLSTVHDLEFKKRNPTPPKVMVFGSSRFMPINSDELAKACGLDKNEVLNISRAGNDYFYNALFIRKNPELFKDLDMILLDILPYQIMISSNFPEHGAYFLRHCPPELRLKVKNWSKRVEAVNDLVVPAWSRSQNPFFWQTGYERQSKSEEEIIAQIKSIPGTDFADRKRLMDRVLKAIEDENQPEVIAGLFYYKTEISKIQLASLHEVRKLLPEDCEIVLVSLPVTQRVHDHIDSSPGLTGGQEALATAMNSYKEPAFRQYWFPNKEDLGMNRSHFSDDEIHFSPEGTARIVQELGTIYKNVKNSTN
jgi:hypothetical protein